MLNLILTGLLLWSHLGQTRPEGKTPKRFLLKPIVGTNGVLLLEQSMQKTEKENTLANILEISCPVGMKLECNPGIPGREASLFGSSLRSFGADQCASSEGLKVTLTPIPVRGFKLARRLFSEDPGYVHRFIPFTIPQGTTQKTQVVNPNGRVSDSKEFETQTSENLPFGGRPAWGPQCDNPRAVEDRTEHFSLGSHGDRCRKDLMNPVEESVGFLVALNPTDEGRIGTGRKPLRLACESNLD